MNKIVTELTPKVITYRHKDYPARIGFPSDIHYSDGSHSYRIMDIEQVKALFAKVTKELEVLLETDK